MSNLPLLPVQIGESPYRGKQVDVTQFVRFGCISRVDYETGYVDITWLEGQGIAPLVRVPLSHASLRSSIRGMPEEGSVVICGWSRQTQTWEDPVILGFADLDLETFLAYRLTRNEKTPDALKEIKSIQDKIGYNVVRGKRRKIYPGEIQLESSPGAELYLDDNVYLSDSKLNEIEIRSFDKSIVLSSNQLYTLTQASRTWNGMIVREPGDLDYSLQPTVLPNGQKIQFITDSNNPIHVGGRAFTEHRTEMYEIADGILKASEVNAGYDVDPLSPYISFVMGTLVGNDKNDTAKYAKVLRPQVFGTPTASEVSLDYLECTPEEYTTLASTLHFRHLSRAQIDIDKEGHLFTFFPASSGRHPLGPGRSWEAAFDGSVKFVIGAENIDNKSMFLDTKGGIKASLGYDKDGKSSVVIAQKGMHIEVMAPANDGAAYYLKTKGEYRSLIDGNFNLEVTGNYKVVVRGKIEEQILGTKIENYVNDKNNLYGGSYKQIITKDKQEQIGYNRDVKITGNLERAPGVFSPALNSETVDKLEITTGSTDEKYVNGNFRRQLMLGNIEETLTKGDIKETITLGNRYLTITTGDQVDKITTGNNKTQITTGNDETTVSTGDIKRKVTTKNSVGMLDEITTGDHSIKVTTGDIKREITTKNSYGFFDKIKTGDHKTDVKVGNKEENIKQGDSIESITKGSKKINIKFGDFIISILSKGKIDVSTKKGKVKINSVSDTVDINGLMTVTVSSGIKLKLTGPKVEIGQLPTKGGIIIGQPGVPTHLDYVTGSPLIGSKTVKASI